MSIRYIQGNMFDTDAEAIVNTVNCVGVMGKGIALEFKKRWPENFKTYKKACDVKSLRPGQMLITEVGDMLSNSPIKFLINFPTKDHWRGKSKLSYVADGLDAFVLDVLKYQIKSVAIPPLGCGNGGLDWEDVKQILEQKLDMIDDVDFQVYAPTENIDQAPSKPEYEQKPSKMTAQRASLVMCLAELEKYFDGSFTKITIQKLVYFMQIMGINFGLKFEKNKFGPYARDLEQHLISLEKNNYITGFVEQEYPKIRATSGAVSMASEYFESHADKKRENDKLIKKLSLFFDGYESPYGMELLATVHFLACSENSTTPEKIIQGFQNWSDYKNKQFPKTHILKAYERLIEDELILSNKMTD